MTALYNTLYQAFGIVPTFCVGIQSLLNDRNNIIEFIRMLSISAHLRRST